MIGMLRPEPDTGASGEPEPPTRRLFLGHLQAFASPDPFDPFVIDPPALIPQQTGDLTIPPYRPYWLASWTIAWVSAASSLGGSR